MSDERTLKLLAAVCLLAACFDIYMASQLVELADSRNTIEGAVHLVRSILEVLVFIGVFKKSKWLLGSVIALFVLTISHTFVYWYLKNEPLYAIAVSVVLIFVGSHVVNITRKYRERSE